MTPDELCNVLRHLNLYDARMVLNQFKEICPNPYKKLARLFQLRKKLKDGSLNSEVCGAAAAGQADNESPLSILPG